ncbi:MAG: AAA family ATPase [Gammaproteobacteria bacterium]|nr:AAA family ATPase [Gammaproteobacteria bacterium]MBU1655179.1 AAA family ATPase [Gammaproteobacteria bacterium]MBU1959990.1 AAA family ATPase [Gammaproteobacteria bacterium]
MSNKSIFEAFGVQSPNTDTTKIPVSAACKTGRGSNRKEIPFQFQFGNLRRILRNLHQQRPIWAHGPSGCGKTELFIQIGARLDRPVHVISFGEETSLRELLGTMKIASTSAEVTGEGEKGLASVAKALWTLAKRGIGLETSFQYGQLPLAMQDEAAIIILDEFNMCPPGVAAQMNRFLETGSVTIPETGEVIHCAQDVAVVVTANTAGGIDETGIYAGSQAQNGATRSRFAYIQLGYLSEDQERAILVNGIKNLDAVKVPGDKPFSALAVDTARACRALVNEGVVSLPFTVRNLVNFARATKELADTGDAFRDAYLDGLSPVEQVPVAEVFHKIFGVNLII